MICCVAARCSGQWPGQYEGALSHQIEQRVNWLCIATQLPACFTEHDFRRV
jgi:hypothetical protein